MSKVHAHDDAVDDVPEAPTARVDKLAHPQSANQQNSTSSSSTSSNQPRKTLPSSTSFKYPRKTTSSSPASLPVQDSFSSSPFKQADQISHSYSASQPLHRSSAASSVPPYSHKIVPFSSSKNPQQSSRASFASQQLQPNSISISSSENPRKTLPPSSSKQSGQSIPLSSSSSKQPSQPLLSSSFKQSQSHRLLQGFSSSPQFTQPQHSPLAKMASAAGLRNKAKGKRNHQSYNFNDMFDEILAQGSSSPAKGSSSHQATSSNIDQEMSSAALNNQHVANEQLESSPATDIDCDENKSRASFTDNNSYPNDFSMFNSVFDREASSPSAPAGFSSFPPSGFISDILTQFYQVEERYPGSEDGYVDEELEQAAAADLEAEGFSFAGTQQPALAASSSVAAPLSDEDYAEQFILAYAEISRGLDNEVRVEEYDEILQRNLRSLNAGFPGPTWMVTPGTPIPILPARIRRDPYLGYADDWVKDALDMYGNPHAEGEDEDEEME